MSTDFSSADVKCPFYMTEDTMKIHCEGLEKGSKTVLEFKNKRFKLTVKERYCEKDYEQCKLYQTLDKKYQ